MFGRGLCPLYGSTIHLVPSISVFSEMTGRHMLSNIRTTGALTSLLIGTINKSINITASSYLASYSSPDHHSFVPYRTRYVMAEATVGTQQFSSTQ